MDSNLKYSLLFVMVTGLVACGGGGGTSGNGDPVVQESPTLPAEPYNYEVDLPAHFLVSPFPGSIFQPAVIDLDNTPGSNLTTNEGATLGRVLFYDVNLSIDRSISCASCHIQALGFSDDKVLSEGIGGAAAPTRRHSMGLANARFYGNGKAFWDQRAASLEEQALMPIQDPIEMGLSLDEMEQRLAELDYYPALFEAAFGNSLITRERVGAALAQFVRSLVSMDTLYDQGRVLQGGSLDENFFEPLPNFTTEQNRGKELFLRAIPEGGGSCFSCHSTEAFVNSVAGPTNNGLDIDTSSDEGACEPLGFLDGECGKFKVPSLRNIAVRPPYMHDARFATLEEVVDHYSSNVQPHRNLGEALTTPGGNPVRLNFSDEDKAALVAFLHTLTDESMLNDVKFSDPFE
jgi:cytochrome c peroxidase